MINLDNKKCKDINCQYYSKGWTNYDINEEISEEHPSLCYLLEEIVDDTKEIPINCPL